MRSCAATVVVHPGRPWSVPQARFSQEAPPAPLVQLPSWCCSHPEGQTRHAPPLPRSTQSPFRLIEQGGGQRPCGGGSRSHSGTQISSTFVEQRPPFWVVPITFMPRRYRYGSSGATLKAKSCVSWPNRVSSKLKRGPVSTAPLPGGVATDPARTALAFNP